MLFRSPGKSQSWNQPRRRDDLLHRRYDRHRDRAAGHAGGNLFRSYTSSKNFLFLESGLALHHQLNTLGVFAGFGIQVWNQQGGLFLAPQVGLDRSWNKEIWGINLKRLFLGYSTAFTQPSLTHFLRLGAGVSL